MVSQLASGCGAAPAGARGSKRSVASLVVSSHVQVEGRHLTKRFGSFVAVDGIDFVVERGETFGFLGPNGAGKTTAMRMIGCVSPPSDGELRVIGMDPAHDGPNIRGRLGVVPQEDNLDTELTVWDNLVIYGRYFDLPRAVIRERAEELLDFVQLPRPAQRPCRPALGGHEAPAHHRPGAHQSTRSCSCSTNRPPVSIPRPGTWCGTGCGSSSDRASPSCSRPITWTRPSSSADRLVIIDGARIVAEGSPSALIAKHSTREVVELRFHTAEDQDTALARLEGRGDRIETLPDRLLIYTGSGDEVADTVAGDGIKPAAMLVRRSSLEDVFLTLTGRTLAD